MGVVLISYLKLIRLHLHPIFLACLSTVFSSFLCLKTLKSRNQLEPVLAIPPFKPASVICKQNCCLGTFFIFAELLFVMEFG
jgi:hypothetical protein